MRASCEVVIERQPLLVAITAGGPARRLMDPDLLMIAPATSGISIWTAVLDADFEAEGRWSYMVLVSRERVAAILAKVDQPSVKLTHAGPYLQIDRTMLPVIDSTPWRSFNARRGRYPRPMHQTSLFPPVAVDGALKPKRTQLTTRGLPLFSE
jgi:hypothetical protein